MDAVALAGVVQDCFPQLEIRNVSKLGEGWASFVIEVNGELVFRFPKRPDVDDNLRKEVQLVPRLARHLATPVPRFDFVWRGGRQYEGWFVGYRKIEGVPIGRWCTRGSHSARMASNLAALLSAIHRFPYRRMKGLKLPVTGPAGRRRRMRSLYSRMEEEGFSLLTAKERKKAVDFFEEQISNADNFRFSPTFIHDDLAASHILCDKAMNRISGVIDWEDGSIGDPAGDFYGIVQDCGVDYARKVLEKYGGEPDSRMLQRARLYVSLIPFYEVLYGREHDEETLRFGLRRLRSTLLR